MCDDELIEYVNYTDESMLPDIQRLVSKDLSEPYSVYTYRYFLHQWPKLSICVFSLNPETKQRENMIATIVCRGKEQEDVEQGYIAMLAVDQSYRNKGIGSKLVNLGIQRMIEHGCKEIVLETEASNTGALSLYTRLGFMKDDHMTKYYLNGGNAYRLKLWITKQ